MFSAEALPRLQAAVADLSWLRTRDYAEASAIKLVGDPSQLLGLCWSEPERHNLNFNRGVWKSRIRPREMTLDQSGGSSRQ